MTARLASDPLAALRQLPREMIPAAIALLASRLAEQPSAASAPSIEPPTMLSPAEVALRLGVPRRWVWDHADELGAVKLSRTMMRIPAENVERELRARAHNPNGSARQ